MNREKTKLTVFIQNTEKHVTLQATQLQWQINSDIERSAAML